MQSQPDVREDVYFVFTSLAHVVVAVLFGMLINLSQFPGLLIIAFAITSKTFALFAGENERFFTHVRWAAPPLALVSVVILAFLPPLYWVLGGAVLLLYWNYPRALRARERSPLDILFHGTRYAILFWLGYAGRVDAIALAGASIVFLFGVSGELLVGLRSTAKWRTTASRLGILNTVRVVNVLAFMLILLGSLVFAEEVNFPLEVGGFGIPVPFLIGLVMAVFIVQPVSRHRSWSAPLSVRRREVLVLLVLGLFLVGVPLGTRVNLVRTAPDTNYQVNVDMRTIVTGPQSWDGQWIIFDYQNSSNYYYVLLHTDGNLEVSRFVDGTAETHLAYLQTGLSPFNSNDYEISVSDGTAQVSIDGHLYASIALQQEGGSVRISQTFPRPNFWVVYVSDFSISPVGS